MPIAVDAEGITLRGHDLRQPPRFIFVTPSHQYPLGMVMSLSRRRMLLEYARPTTCWIIEDDYDSEFRYGSRPLASLQGLDTDGRVIYLGTFSKTLFPGLRIGFMVVPEALANVFASAWPSCTATARYSCRRYWPTSWPKAISPRTSDGCGSCMPTAWYLLQAIDRTHFGDRVGPTGGDAGLHLTLGCRSIATTSPSAVPHAPRASWRGRCRAIS